MRFPNRQNLVKIGLLIGTLLISLPILGLLVYQEREVLLTYDWQIQYHLIFIAFAMYSLGLFLASFVWANLMKKLGSHLTFKIHFQIFIISNVIKRLPGTIWYVASRSILYKQHKESARLITAASAIELVVGIVAGLLLVVFWADILLDERYFKAILIISGILFLGILHPKFLGWLFKRIGVSNSINIQYRSLFLWIGIYAIIWCIGGGIFFLAARAVYKEIFIESLGYVIGSWTLVGTLSVIVFMFPSNFGITEVGLSLLLSRLMPSSIAVLISVLARILLIIFEIAWAFIMIYRHTDTKILTTSN